MRWYFFLPILSHWNGKKGCKNVFHLATTYRERARFSSFRALGKYSKRNYAHSPTTQNACIFASEQGKKMHCSIFIYCHLFQVHFFEILLILSNRIFEVAFSFRAHLFL
jgi:hypothetical protein